jgi:single-stranded DNA-specific DHH superfamily exonuclease
MYHIFMPEVLIEEAKGFFDKINESDDVVVIHHDDVDGFCSGILFYDYCLKKGARVKSIPFEISSDQEITIKQLKKANKVVICDLAPNTIIKILNAIGKKEVFYTDHHPKDMKIPESVLEYRTAEFYIPSSRTAYEIVGGKKWISIAGVIGDMGHLYNENKDYLEDFFKEHKINLKDFLEKIVFIIHRFLIYFHKKKKKAFIRLQKINDFNDIKKLKRYSRIVQREIEKHINDYKTKKEEIGIISFYLFSCVYPIKSLVSSELSFLYKDDLIVFGVLDGERILLSARTQNQEANMSELLKFGIRGLKNAGAGGHRPAAGGCIEAKDLETFKDNLKDYKF